jgi:hypothetical protein
MVPPTVTVLLAGVFVKLLVVRVRLDVNDALPVVMEIPPVVVRALGTVMVFPAVMFTFNEPVPMLAANSGPAVISTVPL